MIFLGALFYPQQLSPFLFAAAFIVFIRSSFYRFHPQQFLSFSSIFSPAVTLRSGKSIDFV
jgi:hypothetical protein